MALPTLDVPKYHTVLPSTGEKILFRPFIVREQKQLLVAVNGDADQQIQAIEDIVRTCTYEKIDPTRIPASDAEHLFLQIRARSIGEQVDLNLTCGECAATQNARLDLTAVQVHQPAGHEHTLDLDGNILLKMSDPNMRIMDAVRRENTPDAVIELIAHSIDSIWQGDEMFAAADYTLAELIDFVENLSPRNLEQLETFFETLPVLKHDIGFECKKCGAKNNAALEGLQSFFG
jgi:hypothetical protein